jgi:CheY-like chemotaxis protein
MAGPSAAESLSILLVCARRANRDEVAQALDGQRGDTRLFWVSQPDLAAVRAQDLAARIILADDELGGASQAALIQELGSRIPDAAILALVDADAMGHTREASLPGARAFVTRPLESDEIDSAFRQVTTRPASLAAQSQTSRLGRLVVFCGPKGGVGTDRRADANCDFYFDAGGCAATYGRDVGWAGRIARPRGHSDAPPDCDHCDHACAHAAASRRTAGPGCHSDVDRDC